MQCFSFWQPWATAVVVLRRDVENRTWHVPAKLHGELIMVHAGKRMDNEAAFNFIHQITGSTLFAEDLPRGAFVGAVRIVDSTRFNRYNSNWFRGPVGWLLADHVAFDEPLLCCGRPGFFEPLEKDFPTQADFGRYQALKKWLQGGRGGKQP